MLKKKTYLPTYTDENKYILPTYLPINAGENKCIIPTYLPINAGEKIILNDLPTYAKRVLTCEQTPYTARV